MRTIKTLVFLDRMCALFEDIYIFLEAEPGTWGNNILI